VDNTNEYFDAWMKAQTQAFAHLREQGERMMSFFQGTGASTQNPFEAWRDAALKAFSSGMDSDALKETLSKTFGSTDAMRNLYDVWQRAMQTMPNQSFDDKTYKDFVAPEKIKQVIDQLFNFDLGAITQMQEQAVQFATAYQQFSKPWNAAMAANMDAIPQVAEGNPQALFKMFQNMAQAFNSRMGQVFNAPKVGKDREKTELMARFVESLSVYATCNIEYQQAMYKTGAEAMQEVMKTLAGKVQKGEMTAEEIQRFEPFFELWIDVNEKTFNKFFQTKEFSRLRNAVTDAGFTARKHYFAFMETQMADLPVALRSEMDDLYKIVYELRKQVKKLESQIKEKQA
jgi:polyhydroxyalkanoate synthesis regulator phasin